jgi:hypothetical protein
MAHFSRVHLGIRERGAGKNCAVGAWHVWHCPPGPFRAPAEVGRPTTHCWSRVRQTGFAFFRKKNNLVTQPSPHTLRISSTMLRILTAVAFAAAGLATITQKPELLAHFNTVTSQWEQCPCQTNWPFTCPPHGFKGACCHGNTTCETQNWSKETCTPNLGTWCEKPPPGYCPCKNCPPKGSGGACCHGNTTCEAHNWTPNTCTPAFGTWCAEPNTTTV